MSNNRGSNDLWGSRSTASNIEQRNKDNLGANESVASQCQWICWFGSEKQLTRKGGSSVKQRTCNDKQSETSVGLQGNEQI